MKKSIQTLVFALLLGVAFTSCKKKDATPACFETAFVGITYTNTAGESYKVETAECSSIKLKNATLSGSITATYTVTAGSPGAYTLSNPLFGNVSMAITATTLTLGGDVVFVGTKK